MPPRLKPIIQEKAKERQREAGKTYGVGSNEKVVQKSAQAIKNKSRDELAKIARDRETVLKIGDNCLCLA
ncbi:hypothetical protein [Clostridium sp. VAP51]|uniref:hypothetical protein n=1 Tax=Clostridium sp. VAP51 TaxID=2949978 RepID=UPI0020795CE5|nr:hypothetical protein [Clostridium sp. VAP51]